MTSILSGKGLASRSRIRPLLMIAASLCLAACVQDNTEKQTQNGSDPRNAIVFSIQGTVSTRAALAAPAPQTHSFHAGEIDGEPLYIEETVTRLEDTAPATKGTPAYSENIIALHGSFSGVAGPVGSETTTIPDGAFDYNPDLGKFQRFFDSDPFADADPLYFFLRMPGTQTNVTQLRYGFDADKQGTITFSYTSPETASAQQDILFAGRPVAKSECTQTGVPLLFHHALTGVKFELGNDNSAGLKTHVTKVVFHGLKTQGSCTVTPKTENGTFQDGKTSYSSPDAVRWSFPSPAVKGDLSQEFVKGGRYKDDTIDNTITYDKATDKIPFADSYYQGGQTRNLNDSTASMTFWIIPQELTDDVTLDVYFYIFDGDQAGAEKMLTLKLGERLKSVTGEGESQVVSHVEWKAGELRTYKIKPNEVDVHIADALKNNIKRDIKIRNTGNVDEYIRCMIVANWVDKAGDIVFGYKKQNKADDDPADPFVAPWALNETGTGANYGSFDRLPGAGWTYKNDGYYYYSEKLAPGAYLPETTPLFVSYTYSESDIPDVWLPSHLRPLVREAAEDVHLEMYISVQAVEADPYGSADEAWAAAASAAEGYRIPLSD